MNDIADKCPQLGLVLSGAMLPRFFLLFQQGVTIRARVGCSLKAFLLEELAIRQDAVDKIQSMFLDGRPVDDLDATMVRDGSVLALSAALPGLVGATMRRGGRYASFRQTISYHEEKLQCAAGNGRVRIKLFNLIMRELGPGLLHRGVFMRTSDLMNFLSGQAEDFWQECREVILDGMPSDAGRLKDGTLLSGHQKVIFSATL